MPNDKITYDPIAALQLCFFKAQDLILPHLTFLQTVGLL